MRKIDAKNQNKMITHRQLGRAVKAIDSKSIGVTRVSSNLTAVDLLLSLVPALAHRLVSLCHHRTLLLHLRLPSTSIRPHTVRQTINWCSSYAYYLTPSHPHPTYIVSTATSDRLCPWFIVTFKVCHGLSI